MSKEYTFNITLHPWGESPERGVVCIDTSALYGYFEHKNGSEGGGLWFERLDNGSLELIDYDGVFELPRSVVAALKAHGIVLDEAYY